MQLTIPTAIAALLPLLATILSSWLNDDHFRPGVNAVIAGIAILATATGCEVLAGNFSGNWTISILGTFGYVGVLMNGDFAVLYAYLVKKPSPMAVALGGPPPANTNPITALGTSAAVPPRASAQQPPTTGA